MEQAAETALDEQFFSTTATSCELQQIAKLADPNDPVHAELRRTMERLADLERELRLRSPVKAVQAFRAPSRLVD